MPLRSIFEYGGDEDDYKQRLEKFLDKLRQYREL
jgi:hypothetical protein